METEQLYSEHRPMLIALAYRMLGSAMDAEDIVQEAFLALGEVPEEQVRNAKSYLCKIVSNRCIDRLRSSSHKRETYLGPWLPEPVITSSSAGGAPVEGDPQERYLYKESLSTAYLLLLQQLSWTERAVFLLREVLQYDYDEIAAIVEKSSTNCRQIFRRARKSIGEMPLTTPAVQTKTAVLVQRFTDALLSGNLPQLLDVLAADAVMRSDGGGKVHAAVRPIYGSDRIVRFFDGILTNLPPAFSYVICEVNGLSGIVAYSAGKPFSVATFHVRDDRITNIYFVLNPDKLGGLAG